jgi:glycine betaine/proline transport system substrate-binding protein
MLSKKLLAISCATAISGYASVAQASDVVIGVPNWPSVLVTAHVLKVAMENNLGLEVELQSATNPVVFEAMDAGSMHVHPEVWLPNQTNLNNKFVQEKQTVRQNPNGVAGDQAMCVTKGTAERTGIENLTDLTDPEMAKNFDTDGDGMGEIWIGAAGWASTNVEKVRAKSYGYDATMTLKEMDESLALAEVDAAVSKDESIVFFCYTPHHMFALHELVILKEPAHDAAAWNVIQPTDDPEWLSKSSAAMAWSTAYLHIHYATSLETDQPEAAAMLSKAAFDTNTISAMTYAVVVDKADPAEFAAKWVADNADTVDSWLQ